MRASEFWDDQAAEFDEAPDHGLRDAAVRDAWAAFLLPLLPPPPARVADLGCGTGTLTVLMARAGHLVSGLDFAPRMVALAPGRRSQQPTTRPTSWSVMRRPRRGSPGPSTWC